MGQRRILPDIFRYWREKEREPGGTFRDFVEYFTDTARRAQRSFPALNERGDSFGAAASRHVREPSEGARTRYDLLRSRGRTCRHAEHILAPGKMTVIDVGKEGLQFGAIVLSHLLKESSQAKSTSDLASTWS